MAFALIAQTACATPSNTRKLVEAEFAPLTEPSLPKEKRYQSILIGIVTPFEIQIIPLGTLRDGGAVPSATTIFEIGSVTKGLVGLSLARESLDRGLNLAQTYGALKLPSYRNREITWRNLAQHTSGLPRLPDNMKPDNPLQPYVNYDLSKLTIFLRNFSPQVEPGTHSVYSNLGAGLAGYGLEQLHKKPLEQVLQESFLDKLGMGDTRVHLDSDQQSRFAPVFLNGETSEAWQWKQESVLQGGAAFRSTVQDMMVLLKTMMGLKDQDSLPMVELATRTDFSSGPNSQIGLFWHRLKAENIVWHNGGTYGSTSFIGYDPDRLVGIVALSNTMIINENGVDPRIDEASIAAIQKIASNLGMERPIQVLKDYDRELEQRAGEFNKIPADPKSKKWSQLKLAHMYDIDQYMRNLFMGISERGFTEAESSFFQQGYGRRFYMMDWQNTQDLKALIRQHGWFKVSEWGAEADQQAWLLVQHADNEPDFQKEVLGRLSKLYSSRETNPKNYAYLFDRVASSFKDPSKRKPQRYGSQGSCVGPGKWEPLPIEDVANVDVRRAEVGLPPLQEYIDGFQKICR